MTIKKRTVGVIGLGHVGAHAAFCLGMMGIADEVLLCDKNHDKLVSEWNDLMDAVCFMPNHVTYKMVDYDGLADCDVIINSVGDISILLGHTGDRDAEMKNSVHEVLTYAKKVAQAGFNGIFVNVTNPCDVITDLIAKETGLPRKHVLGTGVCLDSARLTHQISQQTGLDDRSFTAFMMGEHGNSQMIPFSRISFFGKSLEDLKDNPKFQFDHKELQDRVIKGGWLTFQGKHCTEYGIGSAAATITRSILHDEKRILPVSAYLDGEYGEKGLCVGVPAVIGADGVEKVMEYDLPADELAAFKKCCADVRANMKRAAAIVAEEKK